MALAKIADLYPDYKQDIFGGQDIKSFSVYDYNNEKIGSVYDIIVDETGRFRYLVVDTGFWIFGKKVLLPIAKASVDYSQEKVHAQGFTKEQAESLPEYDDNMTVDYDYEERVRTVYRGVEYEPNNTVSAKDTQGYDSNVYNQDSYDHEHEPSLYAHQDHEVDDRQSLKLYEERLVANKERFRAGGVTIGKRVETETANVSVPVERERVVIERTTPTNTNVVAPGEVNFNEGEVARVEVYEETAKIEKQAFVREEVNIHKEVEKDVVSANETIRREELEVETDGNAVVDKDL
jgi:uncharacterized protein (TIGR02271 family)